MNTLLDDKWREYLKPEINQLFELCPEMMSRKILEANVQQGFTFSKVKLMTPEGGKILCAGSFEDTAARSLLLLGYDVTCIDPAENMDLNTFYHQSKGELYFNTIFSTSVLEHVKNDEEFIAQMCGLLKPNGFGILTCDFRNDYKPGDPKPGEDERLYTEHDLTVRLHNVQNCIFLIISCPF